MTAVMARTGLAAALSMLLAVSAQADSEPTVVGAFWSFTAIGQVDAISGQEEDDGVGGWFDQYDFTPNKDSGFPLQLGIRDASLDVLFGEDVLFQTRLRSPSANLGVSGSDVDDPFFNQHLDALARFDGFALDLGYRRIRTEQLRVFPNTRGPGLVFADRTDDGTRFFRDRTGFDLVARLRPYDLAGLQTAPGAWLEPELEVRGGYESREGDRQVRFLRGPSNDWLGLARDRDHDVGEVGTGLLIAPHGLFTLVLDFDHEQVRVDDPVLQDGDLGFPPPGADRTIGFVPETDRYTGTIRFNSRIGERATLEGGFVVSELEQVSEYTPRQRAASLRDNSVRTYGANLAVDANVLDFVTARGVFKYDRRENDIERDTALFDGTQVDPFVEDWERILLEGEVEAEVARRSRVALGLQYEDVSRDLDFAPPGQRRILEPNAHIDRDSRIVTLYGRASAQPWRRLRVRAELGYRWAPETGYAMELNDNLFGEARASWTFDLPRPLAISAYVRGGTGDNEDFTLVSGMGPDPDGARLPRSYERTDLVAGGTVSHSPADRLDLSLSVFYGRHDQDATLDLSTLQRYFQDVSPIDFTRDGKSRFENEQLSVVLGVHARLLESTNATLSYSFTRAQTDYGGSDLTPALQLVDESHRVDSDTHVMELELRHEVRPGVEILGGYRFQDYDSDVSQPVSQDSAVSPFDPSAHQHTVTVGVSLTNEFFER